MPAIAISYRRSDSQAITGRIHDRLVARFGKGAVFIDIDSIPPGVDFRTHIDEMLRDSALLLVLIGPGWLGSEPSGRTRIMEPRDFVRLELEAARRLGLRIIPVLLDNASMPEEGDLPPSLDWLPFTNALHVSSGRDFHAHTTRLLEAIAPLLKPGRSAKSVSPLIARGRRALMIVVGGAVLIGGLLWQVGFMDAPTPRPSPRRDDTIALAPPPPQPAPARTYLVFFDWNSAALDERDRIIIAEARNNADRVNATHIEVTGHADTSLSSADAQQVSQLMATAVATELVRLGYPRENILVRAYGKTRLLVLTADGVREPQNRRVEIVLR